MPADRIPFQDATDLASAMEKFGLLRGSPEEIAAGLRQIRLGWPAEREFAAISVWMGKCVLIHRLDPEGQFPGSSREEFRVPDYVAAYRAGGEVIPVLIEVKTTRLSLTRDADGKLRQTRSSKLILGERYAAGLRAYSKLVGLPLLIAWKIRGPDVWLLFDADVLTKAEEAYHAEMTQIVYHDLMGLLVGSVVAEIAENSRWELEYRKLEERGSGGFVGQIVRNELVAPTGAGYVGTDPLFEIVMSCPTDVKEQEDGTKLIQSFYVPYDHALMAYRLIDRAVQEFGSEEGEEVEWLRVLREESFRFSYADVLNALEAGGKEGIVNYVLHVFPSTVPNYLEKAAEAARSEMQRR